MATYANMCEVLVGDVVQCLMPDDCKGLVANQNYTVSGVVTYSTSQFVQLREKCSSLEYPTKWFQLISRCPSPAKAEPLVKWPEEKLVSYEMLKCGDLFVSCVEPQVVRVKTSIAYYINISGQHAGTFGGLSPQDPVRRIQFNAANKEPVFVVI